MSPLINRMSIHPHMANKKILYHDFLSTYLGKLASIFSAVFIARDVMPLAWNGRWGVPPFDHIGQLVLENRHLGYHSQPDFYNIIDFLSQVSRRGI